MNVPDPSEVALRHLSADERKVHFDRAEFSVFQTAVGESKPGAIPNEKPPRSMPLVELPKS